ncbi:hypothetical protein HSX11_03375 [Oxalobacteraceae bacterium]|nr:hypothetical protein [Oxalobacteraceae bacterium]
MDSLNKSLGIRPTEPDTKNKPASETIEERRQRRRAAIQKSVGLWKDRTDIPTDGLEYQRQLRGEWE